MSGTDRCAEVAHQLDDHDIIINVQGDEPFIDPDPIEQMIRLFKEDMNVDIATLYSYCSEDEDVNNSNIVKVVTNVNDQALYFSRSLIPSGGPADLYKKHIGVYGFWRDVLIKLSELQPTPLELSERLEQLRWLENGYKVFAINSSFTSISIDTPSDLAHAHAHLETIRKH